MPDQDAVVAITSGTSNMGLVMNLVWDHLLPAFAASALPPDKAADDKLKATLAGLTLPPQAGDPGSAAAKGAIGKRFEFTANAQGMEALTLDAIDSHGEASFTVRLAGADQHISAAPGAWRKGTLTLGSGPVSGGTPTAVAASGAWTSADTYTLQVVQYPDAVCGDLPPALFGQSTERRVRPEGRLHRVEDLDVGGRAPAQP